MRQGDVIGVCAPAGPVEPATVEKGVAALRALGFDVRLSPGLLDRSHFTAGEVEGRLNDLQALFADEAVAGIVCARGGAGSARLLPRLDPSLLQAHPKVFVGYSDITLLHLFLNRLGHVTFHGPMLARELAGGAYDRDSFRWALLGEGSLYASGPEDLLPLRAGSGEGVLRGGCLSLLAGAAGTPWALQPEEDTILFLEDVDEPPYRIDRLLFQLRESGALAHVRGIVFGDMRGCSPSISAGYGLEDVILRALAEMPVPIALGLSSGHTSNPCLTLPLGIRARLACGPEEARFEYLEVAVS